MSKRLYALAFAGTVWEFTVAPEALDVSYPARAAATPTLAAAYVDMFGPGIGSISISGTTGWGKGAKLGLPDGLAHARSLTALYQAYLIAAAAAAQPDSVSMLFVDGYAGETFEVVPDQSGLRWQQNKASPLIRRFTLGLTIVRALSNGRIPDAIAIGKLQGGVVQGSALAYTQEAQALLGDIPQTETTYRYSVQSGDTLASIAQLFGVAVQDIQDANAIRYPDRIKAGLILAIPGS